MRIEDIRDNEGIKVIKKLEKYRFQSITNGFSKLVFTKSSYANKIDYRAMPNNYVYTSNVKAPLLLLQT